jgi:hypothetical protein
VAKLGVPANTVSVVGVEKQVVAGAPLVAAVPALRAGNGSPATALQQRFFGSKSPCLLCPRGCGSACPTELCSRLIGTCTLPCAHVLARHLLAQS